MIIIYIYKHELFTSTCVNISSKVCYIDKLIATKNYQNLKVTNDYEQVAAKLILNVGSRTTLWFSNLPGPQEKISFCRHEVAYIAPTCYGQPTVSLSLIIVTTTRRNLLLRELILKINKKLCYIHRHC